MKLTLWREDTLAHESLIVGVMLALSGGFLDTYTYTLRGGVFANAQTGNLVLMAVKLADFDFSAAFYYFIPVTAFFCGVLLTEIIKRRFSGRKFLQWQHMILLLEILLLAIIGFLPLSVSNAVVNVTISFICSVQVQSFRKTKGLPYATTMCTGNLRSAADNFSAFLFNKERESLKKCLRYLIIIGMFCVGAATGALSSRFVGTGSVWSCCGLLILVFLLLVWDQKNHQTAG